MSYKIKYLDGTEKEFETLRGADLYRANLYRADLYGADLRGANLYGADLYEADLRGANLYGADLYGADLTYCEGIVGFYLGKHFGFYHVSSNYLKIGCVGKTLEEWIEEVDEVGRKNNYSEAEIKRYKRMIHLIGIMKDEGEL